MNVLSPTLMLSSTNTTISSKQHHSPTYTNILQKTPAKPGANPMYDLRDIGHKLLVKCLKGSIALGFKNWYLHATYHHFSITKKRRKHICQVTTWSLYLNQSLHLLASGGNLAKPSLFHCLLLVIHRQCNMSWWFSEQPNGSRFISQVMWIKAKTNYRREKCTFLFIYLFSHLPCWITPLWSLGVLI